VPRRWPWCPSCGLWPAVHDGQHRADCLAPLDDIDALRLIRAYAAACRVVPYA
jgi:hypothetical protein